MRNETRLEKNEMRLARNETRGGNLLLSGTVSGFHCVLITHREELQIFACILWPHHNQILQEASRLSEKEDQWHTLQEPGYQKQNKRIVY